MSNLDKDGGGHLCGHGLLRRDGFGIYITRFM